MSAPPVKVLLIDGKRDRTAVHQAMLESQGYAVRAIELEGALDQLDNQQPDVAVIDLTGPPAAKETLQHARQRHPNCAFVALAASGSSTDTTEAIRLGADAAIPSDISPGNLKTWIQRVLERATATRDAARLRKRADETLSLANFDTIIGSHPAMQALLKKVAQVAHTKATVLISGESGTGKELVAAAIHHNSKRSEGPFVRLNCAALADTVLESELFGHERGAFTGALSRREGRFKQADMGTLFLDEISELSPQIQLKLLRFLQEREFERVGSNETIKVDVRIVAATNKNLRALVEDSRFREDLYYRLNVVALSVPPLRARPSDIVTLAEHFLNECAQHNEIDVRGFSEAAKRVLLDYPWPGNVRELQNTIEQAVVLSEGPLLEPDDLPISDQNQTDRALRLMIPGATMLEIERYAIAETLKAVGGSTSKAAEILGISRRTVQYRVKEWGLTLDPLSGLESRDSEKPSGPKS